MFIGNSNSGLNPLSTYKMSPSYQALVVVIPAVTQCMIGQEMWILDEHGQIIK